MGTQPLVFQRKIIGVLIRAAREKAHRSVKQVAQRLGVSPERVRQYELGTREISVPELENLALYLETPLSYFLNRESKIENEIPARMPAEQIKVLRAMAGAKLKQARLAAGKSKEECAQAIGRKPAMIGRYERGLADIPITELERLGLFLGVTLNYFLGDTVASQEPVDAAEAEKLARLPKDLRRFVLDPGNLPYLRMAVKFSDLPSDKLKELGEILLVVR